LTTVLIDGYALSDNSHQRGIGTVVKRLVSGLGTRPGILVKVLASSGVPLPEGVELAMSRQRAPRRFRDLEHDLRLPAKLDKLAPDVFLSPAQHPPRRSSVPWVQTLHDLTPLTWPHPVLAGDRRRWMRMGPRLQRASAVVAVSRFSADQGIRHLGLDPRVVTVIPHGVDHAVFHPAEAPAPEVPYLLHVGAWGPHKGFGEALSVISRLAEQGLPHRLVLAGPQDSWMSSQLARAPTGSRSRAMSRTYRPPTVAQPRC
jgi:glycosyltransferase involved in cell wall biosynthesis